MLPVPGAVELPVTGPLSKTAQAALLKQAAKAPFPQTVNPMLATLVARPPDQAGWLYEIKWDGYRAVALAGKKEVNLLSRNNKSFNEKFYPVLEAVRAWGIHAVVDGEIVVLNAQGASTFSDLQNWRSEADGELYYYVFDLLWLDGYDLTMLPLSARRDLLRSLLPAEGIIRMSDNFSSSPADLLEAAQSLGLEGIIAKKEDSVYRQGDRSSDWLKLKVNKRHEVVIGGFTRNEGSRKQFSSLLVGVFEHKVLQYTGKIGTGFSDKLQQEMMALFKPLISATCPFPEVPDINKPSRFRPNPPKATATWLKPVLVCEVSYAEITQDGVMRHPSFEGMREDKNAADVGREKAVATKATATTAKDGEDNALLPAARLLKPSAARARRSLLNPTEETQVKKVGGHELKFSHAGKVYWPDEGYTKRQMINYYYQVAPYILPYLVDRPQSMNRFPGGIKGKSFYQKDITGKAPSWIAQYPYHTSDGEDKNFLVVKSEADLLYMANLGCIEMNPWNSDIHHPDHPTWCLIDLDPAAKNTFAQVIETAQVTRQLLDSMGIKSYCKTSGSTGLHVYIPLAARYSYDECQLFGKLIATRVQAELPRYTSIERMTKNRVGKLYIDYLQNRPKATLAAPYSLRPKPGATVSMPLHWEEVKPGLKMKDFTLRNAMARVQETGDLFQPVLGEGIDLAKALKKLDA